MKKTNYFYILKEKFKKSNTIVISSILLLIISSIITISTGAPIIYKFINENLFYKSYIQKKLENLVAGAQISNFINQIGEPVYIEKINNDKNKEYVFINKLFYLDAIADNLGNVIQYAITTRDKNFNPIFESPMYTAKGDKYKVILGLTKLVELPELPFDIDACVGAHNWLYYETHYLGNPSNYQTYAFGLNQSGVHQSDFNNLTSLLQDVDKDYCKELKQIKNTSDKFENFLTLSSSILELRKHLIINTFVITASFQEVITNSFGIGPDYNKVRVFKREF